MNYTTNSNPAKLIQEEQDVLDRLIEEMLDIIGTLATDIEKYRKQWINARDSGNPDEYANLLHALEHLKTTDDKTIGAKRVIDELYHTRLMLEVHDDDGKKEDIELKIGLHTYQMGARIFVDSWKMPVCRHYLIDNSSLQYIGYVGSTKTDYNLLLKRKIETRFTKVKDVIHMYPIVEEEDERLVYDKFLEELLSRRSSPDFKNIVFSIQQKQGEIIQSPFNNNIIVQGCAGSGKSMIMLHRLPILIYDNPDLGRSSIYVITPSRTYIQMAEKMMEELEISDINMGTLRQYYDLCIKRYGADPAQYGKIRHFINIPQETREYIYSDEFIGDINEKIQAAIGDALNLSKEHVLFGIHPRNKSGQSYRDIKQQRKLELTDIITVHEKNVNAYSRSISSAMQSLSAFRQVLTDRHVNIIQSIRRKRTASESLIVSQKKEIEKLNPNTNKVAIANRNKIIEAETNNIEKYDRLIATVEMDSEYKETIEQLLQKLDSVVRVFNDNSEKTNTNEILDDIKKIGSFIGSYYSFDYEVGCIIDPYLDYEESLGSRMVNCRAAISALQNIHLPLLSNERYREISTVYNRLNNETKNLEKDIYDEIMESIGVRNGAEAANYAINDSPYIFLQILFTLNGAPEGKRESLITIDEAQNLSPNEFKLIKSVNGNRTVLNLFGDVNQHIENSKGISKWSNVGLDVSFNQYNMLENYRNARQITEYCNSRFNMEMIAINFDGNGVHEITTEVDFAERLEEIFVSVQKSGISTIIVKDIAEASFIKESFPQYLSNINDMTTGENGLSYSKWNLMTVEEIKGLEFETVIAISGRMTDNEKYIAYTRALDELYVYDVPMNFPDSIPDNTYKEEKLDKDNQGIASDGTATKNKDEKETSVPLGLISTIKGIINHKKEDTLIENSQVRDYFESKGLKVHDLRDKDGILFVQGSRAELEPYVDEATELFGLSGKYGSIHNRSGWMTKSLK